MKLKDDAQWRLYQERLNALLFEMYFHFDQVVIQDDLERKTQRIKLLEAKVADLTIKLAEIKYTKKQKKRLNSKVFQKQVGPARN